MEIRIGKTARKCLVSDQAFVHGDQVTSLVRLQDQCLVREDYAQKNWDPARAQGAVAVWSTTFYDPSVAEQEPPEIFSPLRRIFYDSAESSDRLELAVAYLAAQLLRRQKVFRQIKESDDAEGGARVAVLEDRIGNRLIEVRDPNLSYADLDEGRRVLMKRLGELEAPDEPMEERPDEVEQQET